MAAVTVNAMVAKKEVGKSRETHLLNASGKRVCHCRVSQADYWTVEGAKMDKDEVSGDLFLDAVGNVMMPTVRLCEKSYNEIYKELRKKEKWNAG